MMDTGCLAGMIAGRNHGSGRSSVKPICQACIPSNSDFTIRNGVIGVPISAFYQSASQLHVVPTLAMSFDASHH